MEYTQYDKSAAAADTFVEYVMSIPGYVRRDIQDRIGEWHRSERTTHTTEDLVSALTAVIEPHLGSAIMHHDFALAAIVLLMDSADWARVMTQLAGWESVD